MDGRSDEQRSSGHLAAKLQGNAGSPLQCPDLLIAFVITAPFRAIQIPAVGRVHCGLPSRAVFVSDLITATFLFAQFSILSWRSLLALASGYLFTAVIAHPVRAHLSRLVFADGPAGRGIPDRRMALSVLALRPSGERDRLCAVEGEGSRHESIQHVCPNLHHVEHHSRGRGGCVCTDLGRPRGRRRPSMAVSGRNPDQSVRKIRCPRPWDC